MVVGQLSGRVAEGCLGFWGCWGDHLAYFCWRVDLLKIIFPKGWALLPVGRWSFLIDQALKEGPAPALSHWPSTWLLLGNRLLVFAASVLQLPLLSNADPHFMVVVWKD